MQIDRTEQRKIEIDIRRENARGGYPILWRKVIQEWGAANCGNSVWLTYAANYLFYTSGVRWAMDPFSMSSRLSGIAEPDFARDLAGIELVVLTHAHADHLDLKLIDAIAHLPIQWVIPIHVAEKVLSKTRVPKDRIISPINGSRILYKDLAFTPFDGLHMHGEHGVPETGYLVEFAGQRWLFPGDTRDYDAVKLPKFGALNGVFAHLWLGKACATFEPPPLLEEFCRFFSALKPDRLVIAHLNEFGRDERDLWDSSHFELVAKRVREISALIEVEKADTGNRTDLY